ncbi:MAG: sulfotransferase [Planctomycetota bacterium]
MNAQALLNQAAASASAGQLKEAAAAYREVLKSNPDDPHAMFGLGELFGRIGRREDALALIARAVDAAPDRVSYHLYYAQLLLDAGRREDALDAADRVLRRQPDSSQAKCLKAMALGRLGRTDAAMRLIGEALARSPRDLEAQIVQAELLHRAGLLGEALSHLKRTLEQAYSPITRRRVLYEIATIQEKLGQYDEAFAAYSESNAARASDPAVAAIDALSYAKRMDLFAREMRAERIAAWAARAPRNDGPVPTFLVGFPRSGTTLTEQIIGAHSNMVISDEKPLLHRTMAEIRRLAPGAPDTCASLDALSTADIGRIRTFYRRQAEGLLEFDFAAHHLLDKQPWNLIELGVINAVFPDAHVIVAHRDPRDVILSCFKQRFLLNDANVHFLEWNETARFHAQVMRYWNVLRPRLTLSMLDVEYEMIVTDFDAQARRIIEFIGLEWEDGVARFHEQSASRSISTPSADAVTSPVHARAIGQWQNYAEHFEAISEYLPDDATAL